MISFNPITDSPIPEFSDYEFLVGGINPIEEPQEPHQSSPEAEVDDDPDYQELEEMQDSPQRDPISKAERRRINNRNSARLSRQRKRAELEKLKAIESSLLKFSAQLDSLIEKGVSSTLKRDVKRLRDLSQNDPLQAITLLQKLFTKTIEESSSVHSRSSPTQEEPVVNDEPPSVTLLKRYLSEKLTDYDKAFSLSQKLFSLYTGNQLQGKSPKALRNCFLKLTELGPNVLSQPFLGWVHFALTRMHENKESKNRAEVVAGYEQALAFGCQEAAAYLAEELEAEGVTTAEKRARIIELYEKADTTETLYNLGYIFQKGWARTSQIEAEVYDPTLVNLELAEEYFRKSYSKDSANLDALTAIAETICMDKVRLNDARRQEAILLYQQAIKEGSQEARYLLALAYQETYEIDKAIYELSHLDPSTCDTALYNDASALLNRLLSHSLAE